MNFCLSIEDKSVVGGGICIADYGFEWPTYLASQYMQREVKQVSTIGKNLFYGQGTCDVPYRCLPFMVHYSSEWIPSIQMLPQNSISLLNCGQYPGHKNRRPESVAVTWRAPCPCCEVLGLCFLTVSNNKPGLMCHSAKVNSHLL